MIPGQTNTVSLQLVHFIAKYVCPFIDAIHWTLQREAKVLAWCEINCLLSHVYYHNCSSRQQYDSTTVTVCVYLKFFYNCSSCCSTIQEQNIEWTRLVVYGTSLSEFHHISFLQFFPMLLSVFILNLFIIAQAVVLPYKNTILNGLNLWFMVLLSVNFSTSHSYSLLENTRANNIMTSVEIILCSITYLVILIYHMYISMNHFRCIRKCIQHCQLIKLVKKYKGRRNSQVSACGVLLVVPY